VEEADYHFSQHSRLEKTVLIHPLIRYLLLINPLNSWQDLLDYFPVDSLSGFLVGGL